jgi:hypothetical protein
VAGTLIGSVASASEVEEGSMQDLIGILRERGVIDESDYESIAARNAAYEAQQRQDRMPALSFWGDFRFRSENFWYDEDATGVERTNRHRLRYRIRLNGKAEINDHAEVYMRFVSGDDDPRSTNQTFGSGLDFDTDDFRIDRAYARVSPFAHGRLGEDGTLHFEVGKVPNPFTWKRGKDFMLWDGDISLEGATAELTWRPTDGLETFLNGGYYVIDENSTSKDPHMYAGQVGFHAEPAASIEFGGRGTYYHFNSLDAAFHARGVDGTGGPTSAGGNIVDGLTGGVGGQNLQVVEASVYLAMLTDTDWPVLVYGTWANNLTAEASVATTADEEDTAWGAGVEIGNAEKFVKLGVGYWHVEANAFPAQFIDSDLFDGRTNREGWAAYASRTIWKNTALNLTAFFSDEIEDDVPPYGDSVPNADRIRLQADLVFKFK